MTPFSIVLERALVSTLLCAAMFHSLLAQAPSLTLKIVEGQGAINNVSRGTAFDPVVEVLDANGLPVTGASITFTLPSVGPGGTFPDGSKTLITRTDQNGRAVARGLRPNSLTGQFDIRVTASFKGASTTAIITQTNAASASTERSSTRKWAIILGIVGGAAAAGALAAVGGGGSPPPSPGAPGVPGDTPAGSITPGTPGFGPPR